MINIHRVNKFKLSKIGTSTKRKERTTMKNFLTKTWTGAILAGMVCTTAVLFVITLLVTAPKAVALGLGFVTISFAVGGLIKEVNS